MDGPGFGLKMLELMEVYAKKRAYLTPSVNPNLARNAYCGNRSPHSELVHGTSAGPAMWKVCVRISRSAVCPTCRMPRWPGQLRVALTKTSTPCHRNHNWRMLPMSQTPLKRVMSQMSQTQKGSPPLTMSPSPKTSPRKKTQPPSVSLRETSPPKAKKEGSPSGSGRAPVVSEDSELLAAAPSSSESDRSDVQGEVIEAEALSQESRPVKNKVMPKRRSLGTNPRALSENPRAKAVGRTLGEGCAKLEDLSGPKASKTLGTNKSESLALSSGGGVGEPGGPSTSESGRAPGGLAEDGSALLAAASSVEPALDGETVDPRSTLKQIWPWSIRLKPCPSPCAARNLGQGFHLAVETAPPATRVFPENPHKTSVLGVDFQRPSLWYSPADFVGKTLEKHGKFFQKRPL